MARCIIRKSERLWAPYSCLTIGYLEETKLYPALSQHFEERICKLIIELFYRFMDDGINLLPFEVDTNLFLSILNSLHPSIRYTMVESIETTINGIKVWKLVFLSLVIYLCEKGFIWTDVSYKETNTHDYLHYLSHHPHHIKRNIPHCLAKRIVVFTSKQDQMEKNLLDLRQWLTKCGYPEDVISKGFSTASLQGPAPLKSTKVIVISPIGLCP